MARTLSLQAREKALDAAKALIVEGGIDGFTVDEVAHRSGVAKTTIYRHFTSAHDLVIATLDCMIDPVATPNTGSLRGDLLELFTSQLPLTADGHLRTIMLGVLSASAHDPELARVFETMRDQRSEPVRTLVELAMGRGEIRSDIDITHAVDLIDGPLFMHVMVRGLPMTPGDLETLVDLAIAGLSHPPLNAA